MTGVQGPLVRAVLMGMEGDVVTALPAAHAPADQSASATPVRTPAVGATVPGAGPGDGGGRADVTGGFISQLRAPTPISVIDEFNSWSVKALRALIESAGLGHADCVEKAELCVRARAASARLKSRAGAGSTAFGGRIGVGTAMAKMFGVANFCSYRGY